MITESIPKSSITADTAFRKYLTLQGCTTLPTRINRLLTPSYKLSPRIAGRGWLNKTFPLLRLNHEFTKWGRLRRNGSSPEVGPSDCVPGLVYQGSHPKQPRPRLNQMKIQEGDSWSRLGKLGPGRFLRPPHGCTLILVQEARTRVLGSARMSQITTSHVAAHPSL